MAGRRCTREDDERLLGWLSRRCLGESCIQMSLQAGRGKTHVGVVTGRVLNADLTHSGEQSSDILKHYWEGAKA